MVASCLLGRVLICVVVVEIWNYPSIVPVVRAQDVSMGQSKYVEREPNTPEQSGPYGFENANFPRNAVRVVKVTVGGTEVTPGPFYPRRDPNSLRRP